MLKDHDSAAIVAVTDIARAKDFYANTLGLELVEGDGDVLQFQTGGTALVVYKSDFAGTNKANAVVWGVGAEIEDICCHPQRPGCPLRALRGHGVERGYPRRR